MHILDFIMLLILRQKIGLDQVMESVVNGEEKMNIGIQFDKF